MQIFRRKKNEFPGSCGDFVREVVVDLFGRLYFETLLSGGIIENVGAFQFAESGVTEAVPVADLLRISGANVVQKRKRKISNR